MKTKTIYYKSNGQIDHFATWVNEHSTIILFIILLIGCIKF